MESCVCAVRVVEGDCFVGFVGFDGFVGFVYIYALTFFPNFFLH